MLFKVKKVVLVPMSSTIEVEADTAPDALKIAQDNISIFNESPIDIQPENVDRSRYYFDVYRDGYFVGSTLKKWDLDIEESLI